MEITVSRITPPPYLLAKNDLPKTSIWTSSLDFEIKQNQAAIIRDGGIVCLEIPPGRAGRSVKITSNAEVLMTTTEFEVEAAFQKLKFADDVSGEMNLKIFLCWLGADKTNHPFLNRLDGDISEEAFNAAIKGCLENILGGSMPALFSDIAYEHQNTAVKIGDRLKSFFLSDDVRTSLRQRSGLAVIGAPVLVSVCSPMMDERKEQDHRKKEQMEQLHRKAEEASEVRRIKLAYALGEKAAENALTMAEKTARHQQILMEKEALLKAATYQHGVEKLKTENDFRKQMAVEKIKRERLLQEVEKAEIERKKYEVEKQKHEAEYLRQKIERVEIEMATAQKTSLHYEVLLEKIDSLNVMIETLDKEAPPRTDQSLELIVNWRAFNKEGILYPRLQGQVRLAANTWVDVEVTATRDAHVYILLKGSAGAWQCLVPDIDNMMGITRPNFQRAGQTVTWPGSDPGYNHEPFWELDDDSGYERLAVLACLEPIDIGKHWRSGNLDYLVKNSAPFGMRGFRKPAEKHDAAWPENVILALAGEKSVVHHFVIDHV